MNTIIGHTKVLSYLEGVLKAGTPHHAYLFVGKIGLGKQTMAQWFASQLLATTPERLHVHPDFFSLEREVDKKTGKTKKNVSIDQVRDEAIPFLGLSSFSGGYKVLVLDDAELLSTAAANTFLKTLEEPSQKTVIVLLATNVDSIPQTILSRCHTIFLSPVSDEEIRNSLLERGASPTIASECTRFSYGAPGRAISFFEVPELLDSAKKEETRFHDLFGRAFHEKLALVEDLFSDKDDHIAGRDVLAQALSLWQLFLRDKMLKDGVDGAGLVSLGDEMRQAEEMLSQNIHPRLLVEHILLSIP